MAEIRRHSPPFGRAGRFRPDWRPALPGMPALLGMAALLLAAPAMAAEDPDFGAAVAQNIRAQTVNPDPDHRRTLREGGVGLRSVLATRRYLEDRIKPLPPHMDHTAGSGGGAPAAGDGQASGQGR